MKQDDQNRKRTLEEFRDMYPNLDDEVLAPLRDVCNLAVSQGATWKQIGDMLVRRATEHPPGAMPAGALLEAISDVVEPELELPEEERKAIWDEWRKQQPEEC